MVYDKTEPYYKLLMFIHSMIAIAHVMPMSAVGQLMSTSGKVMTLYCK